jgi:[CysO sulfur-carrier protein]-S-L-cysteine hydrolase
MVELDRVFFDEMVEHGLAAFPNEACGLLAGKEGRPVKFFAMTNQDASSSTYRFDSVEQYRAQAEIDDQGWETLAVFHTHTHTEAYPSETDVRLAFWPGPQSDPKLLMFPGSYYLIMSLKDRSAPDLRAFLISEEGAVAEEEVEVT